MFPHPVPPADSSAPQLQILLVEDEESLRTLLVRFLQRAGYVVAAAGDGAGACNAYSPHPDRFMAVVLDLTLPDMSGEALLERLRASRPDLPAIVLSGTARSATEFTTPAAAGRFLQKPFLPARLIEALAEFLPAQSSSESTAS